MNCMSSEIANHSKRLIPLLFYLGERKKARVQEAERVKLMVLTRVPTTDWSLFSSMYNIRRVLKQMILEEHRQSVALGRLTQGHQIISIF